MRRRSLIFRYTLLHATLFILVLSGALAFLYWSTLSAHENRLDTQIRKKAEDLRSQLDGLRTVTEMAAVVSRTTNERAGQTTVYMLATASRQYVAGNLRQWPRDVESRDDLLEFPLEADGSQPRARGRAFTLPAGQKLLVAQNLNERVRLRHLIRNAFLAALILSVALGVGGAFLLSRRVSRHLDDINRNSVAILGGDLARRMPESGRGDEFDELSGNLNRMLDRISGLMSSLREVTDDIAHDMRSPISRLRSRIEVALLGKDDPDEYRRALEATVRDTDAILAMFNSLLTIARAESTEPRSNFEELELDAIVSDAVEMYEPAAEDAGLRLLLDPGPNVRVLGNSQLLRQALANLLDNAIKYVPTGGTIRCRLTRTTEEVFLTISDDGPGIPEEFFDKAFDRFSRVEESRTSVGSGLGLSLVRAIAHLHGGEVGLTNANPGLVVTLQLPARPPS